MLGGEGGSSGQPRRMGNIHQHISSASVWDGTIPKCRWVGGSSDDLCLSCSKESPIIAILANAYDTFDLRCEKSSARIVCCTPALYVWLVSHVFFIMKVDLFVPYKVIACAPKRVKQIGKNSWQA